MWRFAFSTITVPFSHPRANFSRTSKVDSSPSAAGSTRTRTAFTQRAERGTNEALHQCSVQGRMWPLESCLSGSRRAQSDYRDPFLQQQRAKRKSAGRTGFTRGLACFSHKPEHVECYVIFLRITRQNKGLRGCAGATMEASLPHSSWSLLISMTTTNQDYLTAEEVGQLVKGMDRLAGEESALFPGLGLE